MIKIPCLAFAFAGLIAGSVVAQTSVPSSQPTSAVPPPPRVLHLDSNGWTLIAPTGPVAYLDPQNGNDANAGGSAAAPVKTLARAVKLMTAPNGCIYQARGSVLHELPLYLTWAGQTWCSYGVTMLPRPIVQVDASMQGNGCIRLRGTGCSLIDLDIRQFGRSPADPTFNTSAPASSGVYLDGDLGLVEGCRISGFFQGIICEGTAAKPILQPVVRRSVIDDCYVADSAHAEGMFYDFAIDPLWDEVAWVGNGWLSSQPALVGTGSWMFDHNLYCADNARPFLPGTVRNCIVATACGCGLQLRPGGTISGCLLIDDALNGVEAFAGGTTCTITGNVVTGAMDAPLRAHARLHGLCVDAVNGTCAGNLVVHGCGVRGAAIAVASSNSGVKTFGPDSKATIASNVVWDWCGDGISMQAYRGSVALTNNVVLCDGWVVNLAVTPGAYAGTGNAYCSSGRPAKPFLTGQTRQAAVDWTRQTGEGSFAQLPAFVDPSRTIESYATAVGLAGSGSAFLAKVTAIEKGTRDARYTAAGAVAYFKAGFTPVSPAAPAVLQPAR